MIWVAGEGTGRLPRLVATHLQLKRCQIKVPLFSFFLLSSINQLSMWLTSLERVE